MRTKDMFIIGAPSEFKGEVSREHYENTPIQIYRNILYIISDGVVGWGSIYMYRYHLFLSIENYSNITLKIRKL